MNLNTIEDLTINDLVERKPICIILGKTDIQNGYFYNLDLENIDNGCKITNVSHTIFNNGNSDTPIIYPIFERYYFMLTRYFYGVLNFENGTCSLLKNEFDENNYLFSESTLSVSQVVSIKTTENGKQLSTRGYFEDLVFSFPLNERPIMTNVEMYNLYPEFKTREQTSNECLVTWISEQEGYQVIRMRDKKKIPIVLKVDQVPKFQMARRTSTDSFDLVSSNATFCCSYMDTFEQVIGVNTMSMQGPRGPQGPDRTIKSTDKLNVGIISQFERNRTAKILQPYFPIFLTLHVLSFINDYMLYVYYFKPSFIS